MNTWISYRHGIKPLKRWIWRLPYPGPGSMNNTLRHRISGYSELTNSTWSLLPTTMVKSETLQSYYTAFSPGFTRFAIAAEPADSTSGPDPSGGTALRTFGDMIKTSPVPTVSAVVNTRGSCRQPLPRHCLPHSHHPDSLRSPLSVPELPVLSSSSAWQ